MISIPNLVKFISIGGLIPVFVGAIVISFPIKVEANLSMFFKDTSLIYAGIILSFLGGCLFLTECIQPKLSWKGLVFSVAPSIWAFFSLTLPMSAFSLAIGFLLVLERERIVFRTHNLPKWWLKLRFPMTAIIVILLMVIGFNE